MTVILKDGILLLIIAILHFFVKQYRERWIDRER